MNYPTFYKRNDKLTEMIETLKTQIANNDLDKKLVTKIKKTIDNKNHGFTKLIERYLPEKNAYGNAVITPIYMKLHHCYASSLLKNFEFIKTQKKGINKITEKEFKNGKYKYPEISLKESVKIASSLLTEYGKELECLLPVAKLIEEAENMNASKKHVKKTSAVFKSYSQEKRDAKLKELKTEYPEYEFYPDVQRLRYDKNYLVKVTGTAEQVDALKELMDAKNRQPIQPIIDILLKELEPLRVMYIERTILFAEETHAEAVKVSFLTPDQLFSQYGKNLRDFSEHQIREAFSSRFIKLSIDELESRLRKDAKHLEYVTVTQDKVLVIPEHHQNYIVSQKYLASKTKEQYILEEVNKAELHYQNSIIRLADRLAYKNLETDKLTAETSYSEIDVNIETEITDGKQTVKAWTIIASGPIQRPHYRFLVN